MAPEQIRGGPIDHRADIFALGATLFEMLSGARPFAGATDADTMSAVLTREPADLAMAEGPVPQAADRIVRRCLEKRPDDRFQSARGLAFSLEAITSGTGATATRPSEGQPARWVSVRRTRELTAWMLAALALAAATWLFVQPALDPALGDQPLGRFRIEAPIDGAMTTVGAVGLAIAPNGHAIAVSGIGRTGDRRIYLRPLDGVDFHPLPGTEDARQLFWSPDSRALAFFASGQLKRLQLDSSQPTVVVHCPQVLRVNFVVPGARGATCS